MSDRPYSTHVFREAAQALAATGQRIYQQGWSPATSSNYSQRLNDSYAAITCSGKDKGLLNPTDIMAVDLHGQPASPGKPSAETLLHTQLYRHSDSIGAVLHTHSHAGTVLTMHWPANSITLEGYELLKAFEGIDTHEARLVIPVFNNTQDIASLAKHVEYTMQTQPVEHAYLIRGHGLYTWASNLTQCYYQLEALETLLNIELERRRLSGI